MRVNIFIRKENEDVWNMIEPGQRSAWINEQLEDIRGALDGHEEHGASSAPEDSSKV